MAIDWNFIDQLEKKAVLVGYVPKNKKGQVIGKSGVTIGTGFDIGQHSVVDILNMFGRVPRGKVKTLLAKLTPYVTLKGAAAVEALKVKPLKIEVEEATYLDQAIKRRFHYEVKRDWNEHSFERFDFLPDEMQTILFSLGYNFGAKLSKSLPQTFKIFRMAAESANYKPAVDWLDTFPSKNPELVSRRKKEAVYLSKIMKGSGND